MFKDRQGCHILPYERRSFGNGPVKAGLQYSDCNRKPIYPGLRRLSEGAADTSVFIQFLERLRSQLNRFPENIVTDSGYGSEENYEYVTKNNIGNYLKYNNIDYEKSSSHKKKLFLLDHFIYDKQNECTDVLQDRSLTLNFKITNPGQGVLKK